MSEERGLATDQLTNIIQVIQLGRKSGQLIVERGEGMTMESGEITFIRGQITQARWNHLRGQEALNQLNNWGACRFKFTPTLTVNDTVTGPLILSSAQVPKDTNPRLHALPHTQSIPSTNDSRPTDAHQAIGSIPRRTVSGDKALRLLDQARLSRSHLHLFLLIDGKRTIDELARLVGKKYEDVHKLLQDLEITGLIYKYRK
jgi:hypothetical protein